MAQWTCRAWTSYTLSSAQEGSVTFDLAVVCHHLKGRWGKHQREGWLYVHHRQIQRGDDGLFCALTPPASV
jgi:hypothetical protein